MRGFIVIEELLRNASDAESAYTQAFLKGTKTFVTLPRNRWPKSWEGMTNPVCPLVLAQYGHPDAGTYWEDACVEAVTKCGWVHLADKGWDSVFWHPKEKALLIVCVDDFSWKAGKAKSTITSAVQYSHKMHSRIHTVSLLM